MRYICCGDPAGSIGTAGGTAEVPPQLLLEVLLQGALVAFHEQPPTRGCTGRLCPIKTQLFAHRIQQQRDCEERRRLQIQFRTHYQEGRGGERVKNFSTASFFRAGRRLRALRRGALQRRGGRLRLHPGHRGDQPWLTATPNGY